MLGSGQILETLMEGDTFTREELIEIRAELVSIYKKSSNAVEALAGFEMSVIGRALEKKIAEKPAEAP